MAFPFAVVETQWRYHEDAHAMKTSLAHEFHSPKGGYINMRYNQFRDFYANLLSDVCHDVETKHHL